MLLHCTLSTAEHKDATLVQEKTNPDVLARYVWLPDQIDFPEVPSISPDDAVATSISLITAASTPGMPSLFWRGSTLKEVDLYFTTSHGVLVSASGLSDRTSCMRSSSGALAEGHSF